MSEKQISKKLIKEAEEELKTLQIYVDKHDHIGSIEKAFCRADRIDWDSMPDKIQKEYKRLHREAGAKIRDIKWMKSNGYC